jgi:hypothetical protein
MKTKGPLTIKVTLCPFCNSSDVAVAHTATYWVLCHNCGAEGPTQKTAKLAANKWSAAKGNHNWVTLFKDVNGQYEHKENK